MLPEPLSLYGGADSITPWRCQEKENTQMIIKFKNLTAQQLAALHAVAVAPENQFCFTSPDGWGNTGTEPLHMPLSPAITILESKFESNDEGKHSVAIEVKETRWLKNFKIGIPKGKEVPVPFRVIEDFFEAIERFNVAE
jgi:hypothetical protein